MGWVGAVGELNGRQVGELGEALRDAFLPDALDELLFVALDIRRDDITMASDYRTRVFQIIRSADAAGWALDLVVAARQARPRKSALQAIAADLGLGAATPPALERIISQTVPFVDVSTWRAQLGNLEGQVCMVEIETAAGTILGTGFLLAPDLCLTNYHVVRSLIDRTSDPARARVRFDFRRAPDGTVVADGTRFPLADEWLVASRPPSAVDSLADDHGQLPAADELDFAVLRIRGAPGAAPVGRADQLTAAPARGWVSRIGADGFEPGSPLFLI